jgi:hypothetical protein
MRAFFVLVSGLVLGLSLAACSGAARSAPGDGPVAQIAPLTAPEMQRPLEAGHVDGSPTPRLSPSGSGSGAGSGSGSFDPGASATCDASASAKTYDVGPGKPFTTISAVPWSRLQPGDVVRIHWRPQPYREKILISQSGTAKAPLRVCGVPGPKGELPILDGENATTDRGADYVYPEGQRRGLIIISIRKTDQTWGDKPRYIVVEGLELRNAAAPTTFKNAAGDTKVYMENAACIFVERGEHIAMRRNEVHGCANGLFVGSGDSEEVLSRDIIIDGNYLWGNGTITSKDRQHSIYTEAVGIVVQNNRFGPLREGSAGNQFKDRSSGTVVRYNWFEGGQRAIDLVDPEDTIRLVKDLPARHQSYVYGNVFLFGARAGSRPVVHYGGDNGNEPQYRKGTLFFYDNTVVFTSNEKDLWYLAVLQLETDDETADVRNNIIYSSGTTHISWLFEKGTAKLGVNWATASIATTVDRGGIKLTGKTVMLPGGKTISGDAPEFADLAKGDLCLRPTSPARGVAGELAALPSGMLPTLQYKKHRSSVPRPPQRKDLGALVCD